MQRNTMQEALAAPQLKGIVQLVLFILKYVAIIELVGTLLLYTVFAPQYGWVTGWWYAMFHAISAFCNAGFDIMGPAGGGSLRRMNSTLSSTRSSCCSSSSAAWAL